MERIHFEFWPMEGIPWMDTQRRKTNAALREVNDWTDDGCPDRDVIRLIRLLHRAVLECDPDSPGPREDLVNAARYVRSTLPPDTYDTRGE